VARRDEYRPDRPAAGRPPHRVPKLSGSAHQKRTGQEEQERFRSILASIADSVVAVDDSGEVVAANAAYERTFGGELAASEPEDLAGVPLPADEQPRQRAARGERFRMEFAMTSPDGTRRWFEAVAEPLTGPDRTWSGVIAIRDVSDRTMRLSLERLMAAAGHELKTPLAALHGYLQLVEGAIDANASPDLALYTSRSMTQVRRMGDLVERLFDVSRIQRGRLELMVQPVDLVAVVRDTIEASQGLRDAPPIRLSGAPRSLRLVGDARRLEQVFVNLLGNSVEHARGTPQIEVDVRRAGNHAVVEVRDEGPGIASTVLPLLFKPYVRARGHHRSGLGLGLFLAREIVTAHGGTIDIDSQRRQGTSVTVKLPVRGPAGRRPRARAEGAA
jgi:two-component system CheB/CheR fusion protein